MDLFGVLQPITAHDVHTASNPSFRDWADNRLKDGTLNLILEALVKSGFAGDTRAAFHRLQELELRRPSLVTLTDLGLRSEPDRLWRFLRSGAGSEEGSYPHRSLGIVSHRVILRLCTEFKSHPVPTVHQMPLFNAPILREAEQMSFPKFRKESVPNVEFSNQLREILAAASGTLGKISGNVLCDYDTYARVRKYFGPLADLFREATGEQIPPADALTSQGRWLWLLTLLTWANVHTHLLEGRLPVPHFCEVQVLDRRLGLSGGRIDGVQIKGGNLPQQGGSFRSVGQLAEIVRTASTNGQAALTVIDLKFAVGDALHRGGVTLPEEVAEAPFEEHRRQIERYLILGALDEYFSRADIPPNFTWEDTLLQEGCLVYCFPNVPPIIHRICLTPEERGKIFRRDVVAHWGSVVGLRPVRRIFERRLASIIVSSLRKGNDRTTAENGNGGSQIPLLPVGIETHPMTEVVDRHRTFVDPHQIVEERGGKRLVMHYDRLLARIRSGDIKVSSSFRPDRGGSVRCFLHPDRNPSLSVRLDMGIFHCFGLRCKIGGRIAVESIPEDLRGNIDPGKWVDRKDLFRDFTVPDEHHELLSLTQGFLQEAFLGSDGETYVREKRMLDPDLTYELGGGFGNESVINKLLDAGKSLDELAKTGLVQFSLRVSTSRGLYTLLARRGMLLKDIRRQVGTGDKRPIFGLPYFPFEKRVTFPLTLEGRYTSFYGRAVYPDPVRAHLKLSSRDSGVRQGLFNEKALRADCGEVLVAEAAFDTISLMQMFDVSATGFIGTKNDLLIELFARSQKNVALAFDNDGGGREETERLMKKLLQSPRFTREVRDFTNDYIIQHYSYMREVPSAPGDPPDWRDRLGWVDWNDLWQKGEKFFS